MQELNEAEMFRSVLNEMLTELKQLQQGVKELSKTILGLHERVDRFDQRLENLQVVAPEPDLQPLKEQLREGGIEFSGQVKETLEAMRGVFTLQLQKLTDTFAAAPKPVVRRISLFPENDYRGNYKYFIRALFLSIVGLCLIAGLFALGQQWLERPAVDQPPVEERHKAFPGEFSSPARPSLPPGHMRKPVRRHAMEDTLGEGR